MRKHTRVLGLVILLAIAAALLPLLRKDNQPYYNGRPLSKWLQIYSLAWGQAPDRRTEAEQAVRAIGTNALPFLLKWIQQEPPSWRPAAYENLPSALSQNAPARFLIDGPGYETAEEAMLWFCAMGTNAAPAMPDLVVLMNNKTNFTTVWRAITALSALGAPALPYLFAALSNTNQLNRAFIPRCIHQMAYELGTNACLPPLKAALQDPDPEVRTSAAKVLSWLAPAILTNAPSASSPTSVH